MKKKKSSAVESKTELVETSSLKDHPKNYRRHGDDQLAHIISSLKRFGIYRNVVIARDNTILAGHAVTEACRRAGIKQMSVVRLDLAPDSPAALKVLTGDNEIARGGEVDDRLLTELLRDIGKVDADGLLGTGFNERQLANLVFVTRPESEIPNFSAALEWIGLPGYDAEDPTLKTELSLLVIFQNEKDRDQFVTEKHLEPSKKGRRWSMYWPPRKRNDRKNIAFKVDKK